MTEVLVYVRECDVENYIAQGWQCWRLTHHHGARRGTQMRTFMACLVWP